jgi:hypothetical protein
VHAPDVAGAVLTGACQVLADTCLNERRVDASTLARLQPGGDENPGTDAHAWLRYHGALHRIFSGGPALVTAESADPDRAAADLSALAALANEPVQVRIGLASDGAPETVTVYPKGPRALLHMAAREATMRAFGGHVARIQDAGEAPAHVDTLLGACDEIDYQLRMLVWTATSEGPQLPYARGERRPQPPGHIAALSPLACLAVQHANADVNWARTRVLERLVTPPDGPEGERPTWSVFFASTAKEFGIRPADLLDDWTMAELLSGPRLAGEGQRAAMDAARADRASAGGESLGDGGA